MTPGAEFRPLTSTRIVCPASTPVVTARRRSRRRGGALDHAEVAAPAGTGLKDARRCGELRRLRVADHEEVPRAVESNAVALVEAGSAEIGGEQQAAARRVDHEDV